MPPRNDHSILVRHSATNIRSGKYIYTDDLLALEALSCGGGVKNALHQVTNPLPLDQWSTYLYSHPDGDLAAF